MAKQLQCIISTYYVGLKAEFDVILLCWIRAHHYLTCVKFTQCQTESKNGSRVSFANYWCENLLYNECNNVIWFYYCDLCSFVETNEDICPSLYWITKTASPTKAFEQQFMLFYLPSVSKALLTHKSLCSICVSLLLPFWK